ncbi:MAG TPA: DUF523 domain-containing protein, partial [Desulfobacteraceae bacterium]|nr:DUF523 domain-containing protein [Desulfobacteraceae bacterium]
MEKILISSCLIGEQVRYDGQSKPLVHQLIKRMQSEGRLIPFCPEVAGGLPVPRPPAEIFGGSAEDVLAGRADVITRDGEVTYAFVAGARKALDIVNRYQVRFALLKEKSPSCGSALIYDGRFQGKLVEGVGVTTALLRKNEVTVFGE